MLVSLLGLTLFLSAFLLFLCQPMVAKMVLPLLGGSAAVWTTCVLFFQTALLAGYVYAHLLASRLALRRQFLLHGALMAFALVFLPIQLQRAAETPDLSQPALWLLARLTATVGLPFVIVSATAPLLQNWLARTRDKAGRDPYFLYAASNAGSLLALLAYPSLIEPQLGVSAQSMFWNGAYVLLIVMVLAGASLVWKRADASAPAADGAAPAPPARLRLFWMAAAFVPSALMLAVTQHISTNVGSAPLLWIVPLAIYLLTFILAFSRSVPISASTLSWIAPILLLLLMPIVPDIAHPEPPLNWLLMAGHLALLFLGAYLCHTALAARRPEPARLTEFYLWISVGGAAGGLFAAILAPAIFDMVLEYPLLVGLLPFFRTRPESAGDRHRGDWAYPVLLGLAFLTVWYAIPMADIAISDVYAHLVAASFLFLFVFRSRPLRFAWGYAIILLAYALTMPQVLESGERVHVARNFFGVKKVLLDAERNQRRLFHGDTLHGFESGDPEREGLPLSYYHPSGPIGDIMSRTGEDADRAVAVVGLGTGTMAAYAAPDRRVVFFEIDPEVETIARRFFTFLDRCGANCDVVIEDGRLGLERMPDAEFDLLFLDAFSSDSIPAHLVSREAMQLYESKLKPGGRVVFHVSNRYLDIEKLVAAVIADAGWTAFIRSDEGDPHLEKVSADYVVAARSVGDLIDIAAMDDWNHLIAEPGFAPWTDDYSNMLGIVRLQ